MDFCEVINNKETTELIFKAFSMIIIGFAALSDIREKKIPMSLPASLMLLSIIYCLYLWSIESLYPKDIFLSFIPGVLLIGICFISGKSIGIGDGIMVLSVGPIFGLTNLIMATMISFTFSALVGGILLIMKRVNGKSTLPFIPFLATGMGVICYAFR